MFLRLATLSVLLIIDAANAEAPTPAPTDPLVPSNTEPPTTAPTPAPTTNSTSTNTSTVDSGVNSPPPPPSQEPSSEDSILFIMLAMGVAVGLCVGSTFYWLCSGRKSALAFNGRNVDRNKKPIAHVEAESGKGQGALDILNVVAYEHGSEPSPSAPAKRSFDDYFEKGIHMPQVVKLEDNAEDTNIVVDHALGDTPVPCPECHKIIRGRNNFNRHMREVHGPGVKKFVCERCLKTFKRKSALTIHMRTHSDERDHECELCGSTFTQKSAMERHIRLIHEKPYKCSKCRKRFASGDECMAHLKVAHAGSEVPKTSPATFRKELHHRCDCRKTFKMLKSLHRHQLKCMTFKSRRSDTQSVIEPITGTAHWSSGQNAQPPTKHHDHPQDRNEAADADQRRLTKMGDLPSSSAIADTFPSQVENDSRPRDRSPFPLQLQGPVNDMSPLPLGRNLRQRTIVRKSRDTSPATYDDKNPVGDVYAGVEELTLEEQHSFGGLGPRYDSPEDVALPTLQSAMPRGSESTEGVHVAALTSDIDSAGVPAGGEIQMILTAPADTAAPLRTVEGQHVGGTNTSLSGSSFAHHGPISRQREHPHPIEATAPHVQHAGILHAILPSPSISHDYQQASNSAPTQTRKILQTMLNEEGISPFIRQSVNTLLAINSIPAASTDGHVGRADTKGTAIDKYVPTISKATSQSLRKPKLGSNPDAVKRAKEAKAEVSSAYVSFQTAFVDLGVQRPNSVELSDIKIPTKDTSAVVNTHTKPSEMPKGRKGTECRPRSASSTEIRTPCNELYGDDVWPDIGEPDIAFEPDSIALQIKYGNLARRGSESHASSSISSQSWSERAHSTSLSSRLSRESSSSSIHIERV